MSSSSTYPPLPGQGLRLPEGSRRPDLGGGPRKKLEAPKFALRSRKTRLVAPIAFFKVLLMEKTLHHFKWPTFWRGLRGGAKFFSINRTLKKTIGVTRSVFRLLGTNFGVSSFLRSPPPRSGRRLPSGNRRQAPPRGPTGPKSVAILTHPKESKRCYEKRLSTSRYEFRRL